MPSQGSGWLPANFTKSLRQLMALLYLLGCDVDDDVKERAPRLDCLQFQQQFRHLEASIHRGTACQRRSARPLYHIGVVRS